MVKYYGRARQRIGSVNTNQIGLKMSGCPSKVGRQGYLNRYIASRVQCNQKYCGPVYYHGQLWKWNAGRCVAKAPRGQSFNSGVGTKVGNPRFACNKTCSTNLDPNTALTILKKYFNTKEGSVILVGKKETLTSDNVDHPERFASIQHFYPGTQEYAALPVIIRNAVDVLNALQIKAPLKKSGGEPVVHVVGFATVDAQTALLPNYGKVLKFGPGNNIIMYGSNCLGDCLTAAGLSIPAIACVCALIAAAPESGSFSLFFFGVCAGGAGLSGGEIASCVSKCMAP